MDRSINIITNPSFIAAKLENEYLLSKFKQMKILRLENPVQSRPMGFALYDFE